MSGGPLKASVVSRQSLDSTSSFGWKTGSLVSKLSEGVRTFLDSRGASHEAPQGSGGTGGGNLGGGGSLQTWPLGGQCLMPHLNLQTGA